MEIEITREEAAKLKTSGSFDAGNYEECLKIIGPERARKAQRCILFDGDVVFKVVDKPGRVLISKLRDGDGKLIAIEETILPP